MSALGAALQQMAFGFGLVLVPFLLGALWQAARVNVWRDYALDLENELHALFPASREEAPARPGLTVVPPQRTSDGWPS